MLSINADSFDRFYVTYYKIVNEDVPLVLFLNQLLENMDKKGVDYFRVAARRTNRNRDVIFQFERSGNEFIFKSIR